METGTDRALRYRARAEQIRNRAETLADPAARETLRTLADELADEYESLAACCDERMPRKARQ